MVLTAIREERNLRQSFAAGREERQETNKKWKRHRNPAPSS